MKIHRLIVQICNSVSSFIFNNFFLESQSLQSLHVKIKKNIVIWQVHKCSYATLGLARGFPCPFFKKRW